MEFKIDTKDTFTTISPVAAIINAKMADELVNKCNEIRQSGSKNFIIDFSACAELDKEAVDELTALHEEAYSAEESLVYTGLNSSIMATLKQCDADLLLNIAPRMAEAVDIISMEILERDLLSEE